jgi:hypothetical protein
MKSTRHTKSLLINNANATSHLSNVKTAPPSFHIPLPKQSPPLHALLSPSPSALPLVSTQPPRPRRHRAIIRLGWRHTRRLHRLRNGCECLCVLRVPLGRRSGRISNALAAPWICWNRRRDGSRRASGGGQSGSVIAHCCVKC